MCMAVAGTCYVVMKNLVTTNLVMTNLVTTSLVTTNLVTTNLVTTNLEHGKHGGMKQGRVNKNWCPQQYIYILARTCHVTSLHGLFAYLFILIYCSIPYYTS